MRNKSGRYRDYMPTASFIFKEGMLNLARYVAKLGWASLFVITWLVVMGWWGGPRTTLFGAYLAFGGVTVLSTGIYVYCLYRSNRTLEELDR